MDCYVKMKELWSQLIFKMIRAFNGIFGANFGNFAKVENVDAMCFACKNSFFVFSEQVAFRNFVVPFLELFFFSS
jgi:hypothetical protein